MKNVVPPITLPAIWRAISRIVIAAFSFAIIVGPAVASPVSYVFDYEINYAASFDPFLGDSWTGSRLLQVGTKGRGVVTFDYQQETAGTVMTAGLNEIYDALPFSVKLMSGLDTLVVLDSSKGGLGGSRGIVVQDVPSELSVYDDVMFNGYSGSVPTTNVSGNLTVQSFYTQLIIGSPSNTLSGIALSADNIQRLTGAPLYQSLSIQTLGTSYYGGAHAVVSNFRVEPQNSEVPEPTSIALLFLGLLGLAKVRSRCA